MTTAISSARGSRAAATAGGRHDPARPGAPAWRQAASALAACVRGGALALVLAATAFAAEEPPYEVPLDADGVQRVTIVGGSYFFRPARVVARAGRPIELIVRMEQGIVPHRFVLESVDGQALAEVELAEAPQTVRVELAPGEYAFHCPNRLLLFKSHRERGMVGTLEVRE